MMSHMSRSQETDTEPSAIMDVAVNGGLLVWVKNEMSKGSSIGTGGGLIHNGTGGWDFNEYWYVTVYNPYGSGGFRRRTSEEAAGIPSAALEENPFFDPFANDKFHDPAFGSAEAAKYDEVSKALAESLPALTFAAGSNPIAAFNSNIPGVPDRNYDMMTLRNGWPPTRAKIIQGTELSDWRHSDIRNMAYLYTHKVFVEFVKLGGLDQ